MSEKKSLWNSYVNLVNKAADQVIARFTNRNVNIEKNGGTYFYSINYDAWKQADYLNAFFEVPEVNAVISTKARMTANGVIKEVDDNGVEVPGSALVEFLRNPNWFQSGSEFIRQTKLFREIFGNEFLYTLAPFGVDLETAKSKALYTISPDWVKVGYDSSYPFFREVDGSQYVTYKVKYGGDDYTLVPENVIHLNDDRVDMKPPDVFNQGKGGFLKGESKLRALTPAINNIKMAYETRGTILRNRGALGILSNATSDKVGAIPLDPEESERLQEKYAKKYGGLRGQNQLLISNADLRWQQMGVNPDRLGLFDETAEDFNKILDSYGMPGDLFVRDKGATFENQKQARKGAYIDTIIPEANEWIGAINRKFRNGAKTKLIVDYLHLPIFQEDLKDRGDSMNVTVSALSKALQDGAIDLEQYKKELQRFNI